MMNHRTKAMVEGALTAAIYIVLLLLVIYTPVGVIGLILLPLPFMIHTGRNGVRHGIILGIVSLLLLIPLGLLPLFPLGLYAGWVGIVAGVGFAKKKNPLFILLLIFLAILIFFLVVLVITSLLFHLDLIGELMNLVKQSIDEAEKILGDGVANSFPANYRTMILTELKTRFPAILILTSFIAAYFTLLIGGKLYRRLGGEIEPFPPFSELSFPRSLLFYFVGALLLYFIPNTEETQWLYLTIENIIPILYFLFSLQGLFFLFYIAKAKKIGKWLPVLGIILLFIPPFDTILRLIGIVDLGFPLRTGKGRG